MPPHISLHNKPHSFESAAEAETNFLLSVHHQRAAESLRRRLWDQRASIAAVVRHHLRLRRDDVCTVLPPESWLQGGFNICIFIDVDSGGFTRRLVFRCPMPHKLAEHRYPGTIDEKVGCEVGSYVWMQEYCADIRIPSLYAFGLRDGRHVCVPGSLLAWMVLILIILLRLSSPTSDSDRFTSESTTPSGDGSIVSFTIPCSRTTLPTHPRRPLTPPTCCWSTLVPRLGTCFHELGLSIYTMLVDELAYFRA